MDVVDPQTDVGVDEKRITSRIDDFDNEGVGDVTGHGGSSFWDCFVD